MKFRAKHLGPPWNSGKENNIFGVYLCVDECEYAGEVLSYVCVHYIILCAAIYESDIFSDKITSHCSVPSSSFSSLFIIRFPFFALFLF